MSRIILQVDGAHQGKICDQAFTFIPRIGEYIMLQNGLTRVVTEIVHMSVDIDYASDPRAILITVPYEAPIRKG